MEALSYPGSWLDARHATERNSFDQMSTQTLSNSLPFFNPKSLILNPNFLNSKAHLNINKGFLHNRLLLPNTA